MVAPARAGLLLLLAIGCGGGQDPDHKPTPEVGLGPDWPTGMPGELGMDSARLEDARAYAFEEGRHTQGVVVARSGVLVAEWYADGRDAESYATSWSVAKSHTSALIGIAIDEGHIEGVDQPMSTWLPSWKGTDKEPITLRHVLQMASGLEWNEDYDIIGAADSDIINMIVFSTDHLAYAAARPVEEPAGTRWQYSSGDTMLLSGVIQAATGRTATDYGREKLFAPMGYEPDWWVDGVGATAGYCCLDAPTRHMVKLGELYRTGGRWQGERVVSEAWVTESLQTDLVDWYGYQWWMDVTPGGLATFSALGHDGQYIHVVPELELVIGRNSHYDKHPGPPVADESLWALLPSGGYGDNLGTIPPDSWDDGVFIDLVASSVAR